MKSEYSRTELQDRSLQLKDTVQKLRFDLNQKGSLRILESFQSSQIRPDTYFNKLKDKNIRKFNNTLNGFENLNYLQIRGKNQLYKELEECSQLQVKILDREAIHRNEMTNETENFSSSSEYLDDYNQKMKLS